ncbi:MAG: lysylphosphatidylglycerol synthase transmembrane domain-containing protein [Bacteroidota bacterium]
MHFTFSKTFIFLLLKIIVAAGLLFGLFLYIDADEIAESLAYADPLLLSAGTALVVANTGIHFIRWRYLLRLLSKEITNTDVLTSLLVGFSAGFFTPAQVGEVAGRIASHPDIRKSHIIGITIIDKMYILAATIITGIPALAIFTASQYPENWHFLFTVVIAVCSASVAVLFLLPERIQPLFRLLPARIRDHKLYAMINIIEETFHNRQARPVLALSLMLYGIIIGQFFIFLNAFESVSLTATAIGSMSVYFIKAVILPISIGDLGVRESASVFFFSKFGVSSAAAFNASMCMFLVNVLLPSIAGALLVLKVKMK